MKTINITKYSEEEIRALMDEAYEHDEWVQMMDEAREIEMLYSRRGLVIAI